MMKIQTILIGKFLFQKPNGINSLKQIFVDYLPYEKDIHYSTDHVNKCKFNKVTSAMKKKHTEA